MTEEELRTVLQAEGMGRITDRLVGLAAPTVRVYLDRADEDAIQVGASKMGGRPDLPDGVPWPSWHEPMAFIAQFNLAEVAPYDREGALPSQGLLSFFYETNGEPLYAARWGLPDDAPYPDDSYFSMDLSPSWRVLYHAADPGTFRRLATPPQLNEQGRYQPGAARFAAECTLPYVDGPEIGSLGLTEEERSYLIGLEDFVNSGRIWEEEGHHLLGYPYNFGGPALVECSEEAQGVRSGWEQADLAASWAIEREAAARWRLLLQVSGSPVTGMTWGGAGYLHFVIEREALRVRDFSRVWLTMQFL